MNSGACTNQAGDTGYSCECSGTGYSGALCQRDVDECAQADACGGRGQCSNNVGSYSCACESGFTGDSCESMADPTDDVSDDESAAAAAVTDDDGPSVGVIAVVLGVVVGVALTSGVAYGLHKRSVARKKTSTPKQGYSDLIAGEESTMTQGMSAASMGSQASLGSQAPMIVGSM